jgi:hypothetical protein
VLRVTASDFSKVFENHRAALAECALRVRNEAVPLEYVLALPAGYSAFQQYLKTEYSAENLSFYTEVNEFKDMEGVAMRDAIRIKAREIGEDFIKTTGQHQINIPESYRLAVLEKLDKVETSMDMFDDARREVMRLMSSGSYSRYRKTDSFFDFVGEYDERREEDDSVDVKPTTKRARSVTRGLRNVSLASVASILAPLSRRDHDENARSSLSSILIEETNNLSPLRSSTR